MQFSPAHFYKKYRQHIPKEYDREINAHILSLNMVRLKWISLFCVFVGALLFGIDTNALKPDGEIGLKYYYLWFDTLLFGLGLGLYFSFLVVERFYGEITRLKQSLVLLAALILLVFCGALSALEFLNHHSVSSIMIGVFGLASILYLRDGPLSLIFFFSLCAFAAAKKWFGGIPVNFFVEHVDFIPLVLFGWLLSRISYVHKLENLVYQKQAHEKNRQLAREVIVRQKAESELKIIHKELEQRVSDRTRKLSNLNAQLETQISEREKLQTRLNHAQKMELIGTMASGIAHDLNNVLSGVNTYPELLLMDMPEDDPMRKPLEMIHQSGKKAADIIQDMLILARRGVPIKDLVNLDDIIKTYMHSPEFKTLQDSNPEIKLDVSLATGNAFIKGSVTHLSTAVMNIVTNAAESMPSGGTISIKTQKMHMGRNMGEARQIHPGDYIGISISDTGVGIARKDKEKIFEPFYTNKTMGKSGTGLGMAIVWGMVKDHAGYIDVKSKPGKGTTFVLYFPVSEESRTKTAPSTAAPLSSGNGEKILIVDDLEDQLFFAKTVLERFNYQVACAHGGEAAVLHMKEKSADLIILDMNMDPGIDGLETYKQIIEYHPGQRAIIASGFSSEDRLQEAKEYGIKTFIKKPYSVAKLNNAVKETVNA